MRSPPGSSLASDPMRSGRSPPARNAPRSWSWAASPARPSSRSSSPRRASPTRWLRRQMADVTVKRLEDFEAVFHGGFRRVRAGLGVSSMGIAVMELPPNFTDYPTHDQAHDRQEEVYTALSGRATLQRRRRRARAHAGDLGARRSRRAAKDHHRRGGGAGARGRRNAGRGLHAPGVHRGRGRRPRRQALLSAAAAGRLSGRDPRRPGAGSSLRRLARRRRSAGERRRGSGPPACGKSCRARGQRRRRADRRWRSPSPRARGHGRRGARASRRPRRPRRSRSRPRPDPVATGVRSCR